MTDMYLAIFACTGVLILSIIFFNMMIIFLDKWTSFHLLSNEEYLEIILPLLVNFDGINTSKKVDISSLSSKF